MLLKTVTVLAALGAAALLAACGNSGSTPTATTASTNAATASGATTSSATPASASAAAPGAQTFATGSMMLHPVQVSATLTALTGVDTAAASMTGRVTEADAREYCTRDPNGERATSSMEACIAQVMRQETSGEGGGLHTARADCTAGTFSSSDWGDFRLTGTETRGGTDRYPIFMNAENQQARGNAGGEDAITAMFETLCPARAREWTSTRTPAAE